MEWVVIYEKRQKKKKKINKVIRTIIAYTNSKDLDKPALSMTEFSTVSHIDWSGLCGLFLQT